jgi:hypothetical protein
MRENGMEFTEEEIASLANAIFQVYYTSYPFPAVSHTARVLLGISCDF